MNRGPYVKPPLHRRHPAPAGPAPVVIGDISPDGRTVTIRCPFCGRDHEHGTPDPATDGSTMKVVGSRLSHCGDRAAGMYRIIGRLTS